ncbi:MAG TPA: hypothetical protein VF592_01610 [Sphingomonas sp.]|uniref:hypothetical protein n=1 Tax=Sphingomonas sp. TaxID=28214 RepID=UPI002ED99AE2
MILLLIALAAQAAPPAPAPSAQMAAADGEKVVCKRSAATGSFVRTKKVCLTRRQWQRVADDAQELGRSMRPGLTTGVR